ncbi:MAG TPA: type II secretion system minor pseudopilin GspJ [Candidatus Saccharimonadia bacterium]|nr:type II secretion system minor pseudopilin GspJ [Candidatus Saccharimonadia bacterium]
MGKRGFALIELLVALAVFAVIGAIAYRSLVAVTHTREALARETERLSRMQFAIALLERDLRQATARSVRGEYGERLPALAGARERIELTAYAFASPYGDARPQLARVSYARTDEGLARAAYATLDRAPNTRATRRVLAGGVEAMRLRYFDGAGRWLDEWPPQPALAGSERLPRAIEVSLTFEGVGTIRRVVDLLEVEAAPP